MSKQVIKDDINLMIKDFLSYVDEPHDFSSCVASIKKSLDNYSVADLYVVREYLKDNLSTLISKKSDIQNTIVSNRTFKIVPDSVGNFFVISTENGQENVVFTSKDKASADKYVKDNSINSAPVVSAPVPTTDDITGNPDDAVSDETDKLSDAGLDPSTEPKEDELATESDFEEPDSVSGLDKSKLTEINDLLQGAQDLISSIDNAIDNVPNYDDITKLVTLKVSLENKIDEVNKLDASDENITEAVDKLRNLLSNSENTAMDILGEKDTSSDDSANASDIQDQVDSMEETPLDENTTVTDFQEEVKPAEESVITEDLDTENKNQLVDESTLDGSVDDFSMLDSIDYSEDTDEDLSSNEFEFGSDQSLSDSDDTNSLSDTEEDDTLLNEVLDIASDTVEDIKNPAKEVDSELITEVLETVIEKIEEIKSEEDNFDSLMDESDTLSDEDLALGDKYSTDDANTFDIENKNDDSTDDLELKNDEKVDEDEEDNDKNDKPIESAVISELPINPMDFESIDNNAKNQKHPIEPDNSIEETDTTVKKPGTDAILPLEGTPHPLDE